MYPRLFGKYVLERELARGGMARVVLATLRGAGGFEKRLVVKQIRDELSFDQQFVRRFVEEAKTTVALSHPNIVPVYELGVEQGTYFLAMELVEGCSIAEVVRERLDGGRGVLTPEQGAYVGMEVCRALDYAHRRMKVVHRDITPRNVMLDEEGQVKLIDFGIAAPALVAGHEILGSPGHMPPEQVEGKELGPPTDLFAVAVLLMEAWSGVAPFRRGTPEECDAAMRDPHPRPSDVDPRLLPLDAVIQRAMRLDPRERQQDAAELGRALRAFLQGTDVTDIARELGDRVRARRERMSDPSPLPDEGRGPQGSAADMGTATFAAREEAIRWSQPAASELAEAPGASTRRLRESLPASSEAPPAQPIPPPAQPAQPAPPPAQPAPPRAQPDPAMAIPTPLMVEPVGRLSEAVVRSARLVEDAARAREDLREDAAESGRSRPRPRPWVPAAVAALVLVGAGAAWRARASSSSSSSSLPAPASTLATMSTAVTTTASALTVVAPTSLPPASAAPSARSGGPVGSPSTAAPKVPPSAEPAGGRALVSLLGDPGTRVSVDGASRGSVPVRVSLSPGQHEVRFVFDPTGESRGERFSVKANDKVTVRAEFTGASPTVRIQR